LREIRHHHHPLAGNAVVRHTTHLASSIIGFDVSILCVEVYGDARAIEVLEIIAKETATSS
jgi:hypothetical protein